jgi:hypothetical protein
MINTSLPVFLLEEEKNNDSIQRMGYGYPKRLMIEKTKTNSDRRTHFSPP